MSNTIIELDLGEKLKIQEEVRSIDGLNAIVSFKSFEEIFIKGTVTLVQLRKMSNIILNAEAIAALGE